MITSITIFNMDILWLNLLPNKMKLCINILCVFMKYSIIWKFYGALVVTFDNCCIFVFFSNILEKSLVSPNIAPRVLQLPRVALIYFINPGFVQTWRWQCYIHKRCILLMSSSSILRNGVTSRVSQWSVWHFNETKINCRKETTERKLN